MPSIATCLALPLLLGFGAVVGGCGVTPGEEVDASVRDARFVSDARVQSCSAPSDCEAQIFQHLCDTTRGVCAECLSDSHCTASSFGPSCNTTTGQCQCQSDEDCANADSGRLCNQTTRACTCIDETYCFEGQECELEPYLGAGIRTCRVSEPDAGP